MPVQLREYPIITGKDAERFIERAEWLKRKLAILANTETVKFEKVAPKGEGRENGDV